MRTGYEWDPKANVMRPRKAWKRFGGKDHRTQPQREGNGVQGHSASLPATEVQEEDGSEEIAPGGTSTEGTSEAATEDSGGSEEVPVKRRGAAVKRRAPSSSSDAEDEKTAAERVALGSPGTGAAKPVSKKPAPKRGVKAPRRTAVAAERAASSEPPSETSSEEDGDETLMQRALRLQSPTTTPAPAGAQQRHRNPSKPLPPKPVVSESSLEIDLSSSPSSEADAVAAKRSREGVGTLVQQIMNTSESEDAHKGQAPALSPLSDKLVKKRARESKDAAPDSPRALPEAKKPAAARKSAVTMAAGILGKVPIVAGEVSGVAGKGAAARRPGSGRSSLVWCLDNVSSWVTSKMLHDALSQHMDGLISVEVAGTKLDTGMSHAGYAVVRFRSAEKAAAGEFILRELCIRSPGVPVLRPLLARRTSRVNTHSWGDNDALPGHLQLDMKMDPHFAQPDTIEFEMALDWRVQTAVERRAKETLNRRQSRELADIMKAHCEDTGHDTLSPDEASFELPPVASVAPTCCLWLRNIAPELDPRHIKEVFSQLGYPQRVDVVRDPVSKKHSGHVVVWMESVERAKAVAANLQDMVFLLGGTPRCVEAELARAGPARGSQSVFDRALRAVLGREEGIPAEGKAPVKLELVRVAQADADDEKAPMESRTAAEMRRVVERHAVEQDALRDMVTAERSKLAQEQRDRYLQEKNKLDRMGTMLKWEVFKKVCGAHGLQNALGLRAV